MALETLYDANLFPLIVKYGETHSLTFDQSVTALVLKGLQLCPDTVAYSVLERMSASPQPVVKVIDMLPDMEPSERRKVMSSIRRLAVLFPSLVFKHDGINGPVFIRTTQVSQKPKLPGVHYGI